MMAVGETCMLIRPHSPEAASWHVLFARELIWEKVAPSQKVGTVLGLNKKDFKAQ